MAIKTKLEDMAVGDIISCRYKATTSGVAGVFSELGTCTASEIPVTGTPIPNGLFYFRKVDKGMLIADRAVQTNISWDVLNSAKFIQGTPTLLNKFSVTCTSPSPMHVSHPIGNITDGNVSTQGLFSVINSTNQNSYTAEQRSFTLALPSIINNGCLEVVAGAGIDTFELLVSIDCTEWMSLGQKSISNNSTKIFDINKPCLYVKISDIKSAYSSASIGVTELTIFSYKVVIRSLTGGNAYLGADGKASLTDKGLGASPANNEWDKYIVNSTLNGTITPGDDNVWHTTTCSWGADTPINGVIHTNSPAYIGDSTKRTWRGIGKYAFVASSYSNVDVGFRPVLEYLEPNSKATNLFY